MNDLLLRVLARIQAEEGQTMVEYGLILALVSVVAIAILTTLGGNIQTTFSSASSASSKSSSTVSNITYGLIALAP
jgi:pilus assembly protein Flp/PilA